MSLNKVMLIGNVGADPQVRYLENQSKVATLRVATSESYTDRNGERRETTEWHTVVCWRRLADTVEKYVKKGTPLYIEGRLRTREWTDQTGNKRYSTEVNADNIELLGRREGAPAQAPGQAPAQQPYGAPVQQAYGAPAQQGGYNPYPAGGQSVTPAPAPAVQSSPVGDFSGPEDDLPF